MKKSITLGLIIGMIVIAYSCKKNSDIPTSNSTVYLDLPTTVAKYYPTMGDTVNNIATLGRVMFYDTHLSINNAVACGSCHKQQFAFADNTAFSAGYQNRPTLRNSPPIQNLLINQGPIFTNSNNSPITFFSNSKLFWDGREVNIQNLISRPIDNHIEMGMSDMSVLPQKLSGLYYYPALFSAAYGSTEITADKISNAIATFIASINATHTRFDDAIGNNVLLGSAFNLNMLTAVEQRGYNLFMTKYNCGNCHHIITNSYDDSTAFMDTGLDPVYSDNGRGAISGNAADNGKFKVPSLHNVALTAPYMHDGRFKTLDEVLEHYSHGIQNSPNLNINLKDSLTLRPIQMNISSDEKAAIIAFLNTFTDNQMISDPKFSNPFKVK